ncbi:unnamed protein product [Spodoptera exigua]|nr:unnamed protein product [Spodoptera exigua]
MCERRTPQQASGGSPGLGTQMLAMEVAKEARASPLPASAQTGTSSQPAQPPQPQQSGGERRRRPAAEAACWARTPAVRAAPRHPHLQPLSSRCHVLTYYTYMTNCHRTFCVGDRFYLCDNKILCEYDYEERLVFANMAYNPPPLAHLKRQTTHLPPPPTSNAMSGLMNGSSRSGDLNNNMSGSSPAPFAAPPHLKPLGLSASS